MNNATARVKGSKNPRLSDQIHDYLLTDIASGVLAPGQRLVETEIAKKFEVSQAPVREALRRLAHAGMVLQLSRRGSFVATIDEPAARRAYRVRAALEEVAAQEFCDHGAVSDLAKFGGILYMMQEAAKRDDLPGFIELDIAFHRGVWEATGNDLLVRMWPLVEASLRGFTMISNRLYFGSLIEIAGTHRPLLDALASRDRESAARLFREHTSAVWDRVDSDDLSSGVSDIIRKDPL